MLTTDIRRILRGWSLGLNKEFSTYELLDQELQSMSNMDIGLSGKLKPRRGVSAYDVSWSGTTVLGAHRYGQSNGNVEIVAYSGDGDVHVDGGTGTFASKLTLTASGDGYIRFAQYRDTLFAMTDAADIVCYHRGATVETRICDISGSYDIAVQLSATASGGAGELTDATEYAYRYAFEFGLGNDRVVISKPLSDGLGAFRQEDPLTASPNLQIEFKKIAGFGNFPDDSLNLLIYRYNMSPETAGGKPSSINQPDNSFFFIGEISKTAYDAASNGDVLFTDDGTIKLDFREPQRDGRGQIDYTGLDKPPRGRFGAVHKSRLWVARFPGDLNAIAFSEQTQPEKFKEDSKFNVGHHGDGLTGILSFKNRFLLALDPVSSWAISGTVNEISPGFNDISVDKIDGTIGCIAPATLVEGEGFLLWLSNKGPVFFDGTSKPKLLRADQIMPVIRAIPAAERYYACAGYYSKEREYWLAVCPAGNNKNTEVYKFHFRTGGWSGAHVYRDTNSVEFTGFLDFRRGDEVGTFLGLNENSSNNQMHKLDDTDADLPGSTVISYDATTGYIDFGTNLMVFTGIQVILQSNVTHTITWDIDESNHAGSYTITTTSNKQSVHSQPLQDLEGYRIRIAVSGLTAASGNEIQQIIIRAREAGRVKLVN